MPAAATPAALSRRQFIRRSAAALAAPAAAKMFIAPAAAQQPAAGASQLTHYQEAQIGGKVRGPHIWLRWNNAPLVSYRAHGTQKYPYFYPVSGPVSGLSLTCETGLPWPHHRSLWLGCDKLNGANYWQGGLEHGQIVSGGPRVASSSPTSAVIEDACVWAVGGKDPDMADTRRFTITVAGPRLWTLDADIEWKAVKPVTVQKTNHSLFAIRSAADIAPTGGGTLRNSEGQAGEKATYGKPARWCAIYGRRAIPGADIVEGIALFDHPQNPWDNCPWFTRDYGNISPTPFQWLDKPWQLEAGQSVRLRYRVVAFAGDPEEARLDALHAQWARG